MDIIYPDTPYTLPTIIALWTAPLFYLASFLCAFLSFRKERAYLPPIFYILLIIGFILQGAGLYLRGLHLSAFPLTNIFEILQVTAWGAVFLILIIQLILRVRLLGLFGSGFVTLICLLSLSTIWLDSHKPVAEFSLTSGKKGGQLNLKIQTDTTQENLRIVSTPESPFKIEFSKKPNFLVQFHAALAIFAYSVFGLLAITSLMFLLQDYSLAHKRLGSFFERLPSLKQLSSISRILLFTGVFSLSLSVILGTFIWLSNTSSTTASKLICAWILFIGYLTVLFLKEKQRCLPRTIAWACIILFLFAMLTLWPIHSNLSS